MNSISNTDIESPEWKMKLDNHLKAQDFFYVDSFPVAILEVKRSKSLQEKSKYNNEILSDLTIRGIKKEISFPISIHKTDSIFSASGIVTIDRTLFNIKYKSGTFFPYMSLRMRLRLEIHWIPRSIA